MFSQQNSHEVYSSNGGWTKLMRAISISAQVCACAKKERKNEREKESRNDRRKKERGRNLLYSTKLSQLNNSARGQ